MRPERPPEEWLFKAWHGDVMVDLIFRPSGLEITDDVLARAQTLPVMAVATPMMDIDDMLVTMLMALDEHRVDYASLLGIVRALREQIDWPGLRARTAASPFAKAFFTLVDELGRSRARPVRTRQRHKRVRVLQPAAGHSRARYQPVGASRTAPATGTS